MPDPGLVVLHGARDGADGVLLLPHEASAVPPARRALTRDLRSLGTPTWAVDEVALVVSELLGNAVRHAAPLGGGDVVLRWRLVPGAVEVEVVDGGGGDVRVRHPGPDATSGRGMHLVSEVADAWGTSDDGHGQRSVWASVTTATPGIAV